MKYIGPHVSISGGVENAPVNAKEIGATGFGMFSKNQRQWSAKPYTEDNIRLFKENMEASGFTADSVLVHDSYLINLGNGDEEKRAKSLTAFIDEISRVEQLGLKYLNFHPGSHLKVISPEECVAHIAASINKAMEETEYAQLVIENTAGQGSAMGSRFEELAAIIDQVNDKSRIGVCLDTCHLFAAGYDISNGETMDEVWEEFERFVGFKYLKGMHLNDAKSELGSHVDRHHSLGQGNIGWKPFVRIMRDPLFNDIPMVLETIDPELWQKETADLLEMANWGQK